METPSGNAAPGEQSTTCMLATAMHIGRAQPGEHPLPLASPPTLRANAI
jgi:hypothetical protein